MGSEKLDVPGMLKLGEKLRRERLVASCITCEHWKPDMEVCGLVMMRPPAEVIALGCPCWQDDLIPF